MIYICSVNHHDERILINCHVLVFDQLTTIIISKIVEDLA